MKATTRVLTLVLCFLAGAVCFASEIQMGTWKLNEAKSTIAAGAPKNSTVVYEAAGDSIKVTIDGTAADGTATHSEWTGIRIQPTLELARSTQHCGKERPINSATTCEHFRAT
jgi:hypothetical protein